MKTNNGFSLGQTVVGLVSKRIYKVVLQRTKNGGMVVQDTVTKQNREVTTYEVRAFIDATPKYKKEDSVILTDRLLGINFIVKHYYIATKTLEVYPEAQKARTFYVHEKFVKKIEG